MASRAILDVENDAVSNCCTWKIKYHYLTNSYIDVPPNKKGLNMIKHTTKKEKHFHLQYFRKQVMKESPFLCIYQNCISGYAVPHAVWFISWSEPLKYLK